jgi:iron complex transport system substrate-binding protein
MNRLSLQAMLLPLILLLLVSGNGIAAQDPEQRIVILGSTISEIAAALGVADQIVAVDESTSYPESLAGKPRLGYYRAISAEGVLSFRPTLVLASKETGPPPIVAQLRQSGLRYVPIAIDHSEAGTLAAIRAIAHELGREEQGEALAEKVAREVADARSSIPAGSAPRVAFIYARGGGVVNVSGTGTAAAAMIALAGGANVVSQFEGYRALTPESLVAAQPELILITTAGVASLGGVEKVREIPAVALTPAGRSGRIVAIDDQLLLGFGPRLGEAVSLLAKGIHSQPGTGE